MKLEQDDMKKCQYNRVLEAGRERLVSEQTQLILAKELISRCRVMISYRTAANMIQRVIRNTDKIEGKSYKRGCQ